MAGQHDLYTYEEEFRNNIATVDAKGKRVWVYPKKPSGRIHTWRIAATAVLLSFFFGGPFIKIDGQPLLLLNFFERRFVILGQPFWPQDFILLAITLITFFVFIILFTVVFGRLWCGWMCPQTLFMEMVFRKIEYWIEGDAPAQRRLNLRHLSWEKLGKKTSKHFLFILISVLISHTAMAYLIGIESVEKSITESPTENKAAFIGLVVFTGIFYLNFAKFREQACIAVCPYGRLQGVLLIKDSIVVAYDWLRGEPRGRMTKSSMVRVDRNQSKGDCIDCKLCLYVCPTGIDIRNGTQLECVNCTACIDACDEVMVKIGKPKGLIRFASYNSIKDGILKLFNARVAAYSFVLVLLIAILSFSLATRSDVKVTILKVPGTLYQRDGDFVTNLYNIEFINKTFEEKKLELKVDEPRAAVLTNVDGKDIVIPAEGLLKRVYFIKIPEKEIDNARIAIRLSVYENGELVEKAKAKFIGPVHKASDAKRNRN
ncbi:MAG: cytochrome c oxidase accessory protein CcoG [Bacteroidetes bacterium]|nr:cytochrome c oxidase accessory protein CcoG [Bacteroidota bacterium]MBI3482113.1 cytochrome c oxidase accessory protein CcoG [Bacteroidota bacterium]